MRDEDDFSQNRTIPDAVLMREMLLSFSLGQIDDLKTVDALGINAEDLFLLMAQARLPMPHLSGDMTREMVNILNALPANQ